jgi:tripartite-type tricarboxylate transporter receptor subunit TctC
MPGRVDCYFGSGSLLSYARSGQVRVLGTTGSKRDAAAPDVPTIAESGYPGFEYSAWYGVVAPAKMPSAIIQKLHLETVNALASADLRAKFVDLGLETTGNSPNEFAAAIKFEIPKWAKVIRDSGIKPD